nr:hypothetical protein [Tanacetum cinerariifolium]
SSPIVESTSEDGQNQISFASENGEPTDNILPKPAVKFVKAVDRPAERPTTNKAETMKKPTVKYAEMNFPPVNRKLPTGNLKVFTVCCCCSRHVNTARPKAMINKRNRVKDVQASACWIWKPIKPNSASIILKRYDYVDVKGRSRHLIADAASSLGEDCWELNVRSIPTSSAVFPLLVMCFHYQKKFPMLEESSHCQKKFPLGNAQKDLQDQGVIDIVPGKNNMYNVDLKNIVPKGATKDETSGMLKSFITGIENLVDHKVKVIRCDNGTEFKNKEMNHFCEMIGSGPDLLFDIDALTRTMNYEPIVAGIQPNGFADTKESDNADLKSSHDNGYKPSSNDEKKVDEDPSKESELADMNNLDITIQGSPTPTTRIHKDHPLDQMIRGTWVYDIIFGSTKKELFISFEKLIHEKFQMSYMGELTFFLGLQVKQKKDGTFISQDNYVAKILKKFRFTKVKTASTPMETHKPLKDEDGEEVVVYMYRSMVGSLMYLTSSRLDIMFEVYACVRYQVNPKVSHLHAMKGFLGKGFSGRVTPLFQTMVQNQSEFGEGSAMPTNPHHTPTILQPLSQPQKTQKPRKPTRKDTQVPQPSGPTESIVDEAIYKELGDSLLRDAITAS